MEQKLTKEQTRLILMLNEAIGQIKKNLDQANLDINAHVELLRSYFSFPEGPINFRVEGEVLVMFTPEVEVEGKPDEKTPGS